MHQRIYLTENKISFFLHSLGLFGRSTYNRLFGCPVINPFSNGFIKQELFLYPCGIHSLYLGYPLISINCNFHLVQRYLTHMIPLMVSPSITSNIPQKFHFKKNKVVYNLYRLLHKLVKTKFGASHFLIHKT